MLDYSTRAPVATASQRRARQYLLRAMAVGGPDAHLM
jgi:hypothetical protein